MRGNAALRLSAAAGGCLAPSWTKDQLWRRARATPSLDLRFSEQKSLVDATTGANLVTFTRASSGTYVDSQGVIRTASNDVPRFDHNPTTGESLGLLVEEQRQNLLLRSEEFGTTWVGTGSSVTPDTVNSPASLQTADSLIPGNGITILNAYISQDISKAAVATVYTASLYVKANQYNRATLVCHDTATLNNRALATVDLTNGTFASAPATAGTFSSASGGVVNVGNGWYRVILTFTSSTETGIRTRISARDSSATTGDGTSGIYIWGAQLEAGAFPTSYIPTTTSAATRSADVASISGSNFSSWYRQDEGTLYGESRQIGDVLGFIATISDGTDNNRIAQFRNGTTLSSRCVSVGSASNPGNITIASSQALVRSAIAAASNSCRAAANGVLATDSSPSSLPTVDRLSIGLGATNITSINGYIRRLTYWPARLPNSTLQALTQ